jgi:glycine cleavage system H protein
MSEGTVQDGLYYNKDHEWVKIEGETATVGISDIAQHLLTDVVFVELPEVGATFAQFDAACVVESVKSVSDVYAPLGGTVSGINDALEDAPELVNTDAYGQGWMFTLSGINEEEKNNLMDAAAYKAFVAAMDQ